MAEDHISLEKIPQSNTNRSLPNTQSHEAPSTSVNGFGSDVGKDESPSLLQLWWQLIYRRRLLIVSIITIVLPLVAVESYRNKSIYQATTTIEVRREGSSLKPNDIFYPDAYDNTKAEAVIIKSRPVIEKTVVGLKLDQDPHFLDVNKKRSVWEALTVFGIWGNGKAQKGERAAANNRVSGQGTPDAEYETGDKLSAGGASTLTAAERARLAPYIGAVTKNLKVESVRETRLLKISFSHTDPAIAAQVSNGIAQNFIDYNFQNKTEHFANASAWLEDSTRKLKARVEEAEQKLANYSRDNNIFSPEGKENLITENLVRLHDQAMRAETDRILKQSLYEEVKKGRVAQLPEAFADPKTTELKKTLNELAVTASQLSVRFGSKHPKLIEIRQQMDTIQQQIDANRSMLEEKLKADYVRAFRDENSLKAALNRAKAEAVRQNQSAIHFSVLQQEQATAKALYTDFLNKNSQVSMQLAEQYNNVRMIEMAESPLLPIGPNRVAMMLIGFVLSLAFGVGLSWLIENLNTKIRTVEDVARATQLPVLAVVPTLSESSLSTIRTGLHESKDGEDSSQQALDMPAKSLSSEMLRDFTVADEAYRMLRTAVLLSTAGHPPRTILIASAQPGDGKTTSVINTAIVFTQLKAEVLIIDCDMRKPPTHKLDCFVDEKGLSTYLAGGGQVEDFIKRTPIPYLSIFPAGPTPPNPSELISSNSMKEMLHSLLGRYDYILIDSPPLGSVTDPMILSTLVDGVILVAKSGRSKGEVLRRGLQSLSSVRAKVLGVILNDFKKRSKENDYYYAYNQHSNHSGKVNGNGSSV